MKQVIAIGLLMLTLGCGQDRGGSDVHGKVIKTIPVATNTRLNTIWTQTVQCVQSNSYVQSVPAPPNVVLVRGKIDCGGEPAVGCTEGTTTVWLTVDDGVFDQGTVVIVHEFIHVILHNVGIFGEGDPAFDCVHTVVTDLEILGVKSHLFTMMSSDDI
jgi:hypothetical protein